ncbi:plasmid pRiA4b ORF-3 family protein [Kineosporia sp. NBRC 101731]|uniref:plasmid pRiA4b ORF-3 family protein n=1 Tax=Kineosporia sp. NBRC 101731 TaxID=3032199 RepID=UPI002553919E|nr:plasmid pRiA4b ORF-3 family protein [Kineosporia sp. NBRC 101731]
MPPLMPAARLSPGMVAMVPDVAAEQLERIGRSRHRYEAELSLLGLCESLDENMPAEFSSASADLNTANILMLVIEHLVQTPGPTVLGLLMVAADLGPVPSRQMAAEAARQLKAAGVQAPRWAQTGPLKVLRAWGHGDRIPDEHSLGVVFSYGHREHGFVVPFAGDDLGFQRLKQVWVQTPELVDRSRAAVRELPRLRSVNYHEELDDTNVLDRLRELLETGPEASTEGRPDFRVRTYLLHLRARQLAAALGEHDVEAYSDLILADSIARGEHAIPAPVPTGYRIRLTLEGSRPNTWRRVALGNDVTLLKMHEIIQWAFEWQNEEFYSFAAHATEDDDPDPIPYARLSYTRLGSLLHRPGRSVEYLYGDRSPWLVTIELEDAFAPDPDVKYPRLIEVGGGVPGEPGEDDDMDEVDLRDTGIGSAGAGSR